MICKDSALLHRTLPIHCCRTRVRQDRLRRHLNYRINQQANQEGRRGKIERESNVQLENQCKHRPCKRHVNRRGEELLRCGESLWTRETSYRDTLHRSLVCLRTARRHSRACQKHSSSFPEGVLAKTTKWLTETEIYKREGKINLKRAGC